ncbi:hypothetical protein FAS41_03755 [Pseudomonas nicosulfuronedens]|uniref:Uncharacterized protein n=1 Tax=Pseudomonas nicosulfuronedens TaxID=2571105 RepID=A0A5R9RBY1_9PSED|nr:hypothetical protein FAS41_03755 [Pseudomonas nicosulfuronedens]
MSPLDLLTRRFIERGIGRHGCMGPERTPVQLRKAGYAREVRGRDSTQTLGADQAPWGLALTGLPRAT